jgi:hypothetical protein
MQYVNNTDLFTRNTEVDNKGTRQNINLLPPSISLTKVQKEAYYLGIKIYNHLPKELKQLYSDQKYFEPGLKEIFICEFFLFDRKVF